MSHQAVIGAGETLVRVLRTPQHIRKDGLHASAFRPQKGHSKVSIVRWHLREQPGEKFKSRCVTIGNSGKNTYCGLGVFKAQACLDAGIELEDAPEDYAGHAHIVFPFAAAPEEPLQGEEFKILTEMANKLARSATFVPDPAPESPHWTIKNDLLPVDDQQLGFVERITLWFKKRMG